MVLFAPPAHSSSFSLDHQFSGASNQLRIKHLSSGLRATIYQHANLIGNLRSNMLASKVERMLFIRLNKHMVDEVRDLDAAKAKAKARVVKSAKQSATAQQERTIMVVDVSLYMSRRLFFCMTTWCK